MTGRTYIRTATVLVRINVGPPTWFVPRFRLTFPGRRMAMLDLGWLRTAVQIGVGSKRHAEKEVEEEGRPNRPPVPTAECRLHPGEFEGKWCRQCPSEVTA